MVKLNIGNLYSASLQNVCDCKCTYIETIELVKYKPESYNCYDKYMNQLAFIYLNNGKIECMYPMNISYSSLIFSTNTETNEDYFDDDAMRCKYLEMTIDAINNWFDNIIRTVDMFEDGNTYKFISKQDPSITEQSQLRQLYMYQQSNLLPNTLLQLRKRGMALTYSELRESIMTIIKRNNDNHNDIRYEDQIMSLINSILTEVYHVQDSE